jgi:transposase
MEQKGNVAKRRKYDATFKEEVLKMVQNGRPVPEIAQSLGIGENLIYKWKSRNNTKEQQPTAVFKEGCVTSAPQDQQALLHKRIRELEGERDILKKALAIFSRQT